MPSRRDLLTGIGTLSLASLAGCSAIPRFENPPESAADEPGGPQTTTSEEVNSVAGQVWHKEIEVLVSGDTSPIRTDVLRVTFDRDSKEVWGRYDPEYVGDSVEGAAVSVSAETHQQLTNTFEGMQYAIRLGPLEDSSDHLHANAYHDGFNQLSLGAEASANLHMVQTGDDLKTGYVRPTNTDRENKQCRRWILRSSTSETASTSFNDDCPSSGTGAG